MPIKVTCTACGEVLTAPDALAGKVGKCKCGQKLSIPRAEEEIPTLESDPLAAYSGSCALCGKSVFDDAKLCPECRASTGLASGPNKPRPLTSPAHAMPSGSASPNQYAPQQAQGGSSAMDSLTSMARILGCLGFLFFFAAGLLVWWPLWIVAAFCLVACFLSNPQKPPPPPTIIYMNGPPPTR